MNSSGRLPTHAFAQAAIFLALFCISPVESVAQSPKPHSDEVVRVTSWKQGTGWVKDQTVKVSLEGEFEGLDWGWNQTYAAYEFDFYDTSKRRLFRLGFTRSTHISLKKPDIPCWAASLREISRDSKFGGSTVGYQLLASQGPGHGHYFPRDDWAPLFCAREKPNRVLDGLIYPLWAERTWEIENFRLSIRATDYQYDPKANQLRKLELTIRLKNK